MVLHLCWRVFLKLAHTWPPSSTFQFIQMLVLWSKVYSLCSRTILFWKRLCFASRLHHTELLPDAKLVANGHEVLLEVKCACPFLEKDDGRGWIWSPFKKALPDEGVKASHFVQCQVQMLTAGLSHCLLAGWEIEARKVVGVPFDADWCKQMLCMLSSILQAAAPLSGKSPNFAAIRGHKEFEEFTRKRCEAVTELCTVKSVKGAVDARWV
ncbi:hypothetical protein DUNSADRAFT_10265 [Dunaliella salina]|uniref:YqaJ viral recombinase domain-containing protein n=1 Tax=Dunaliella salina TaxID=3046 RepID=A0ABQ7GFR2_DUNSA|nr:hypothetical protein DUNSADRAFT_10265 [Dunaliella salina]|eukprot:KAF5833439.1 hypothetical protein DUNSADRAFT_10265 [Dunaliella salina]